MVYVFDPDTITFGEVLALGEYVTEINQRLSTFIFPPNWDSCTIKCSICQRAINSADIVIPSLLDHNLIICKTCIDTRYNDQ